MSNDTIFKLTKKCNLYKGREVVNHSIQKLLEGVPFYVHDTPSRAIIKIGDMDFIFKSETPSQLLIRPRTAFSPVGCFTYSPMDAFNLELLGKILLYEGEPQRYAESLAGYLLEYRNRERHKKTYGKYPYFDIYEEPEVSFGQMFLKYTMHMREGQLEKLRTKFFKELQESRKREKELDENHKRLNEYIEMIERDLSEHAIAGFFDYFVLLGFRVAFEKTGDGFVDRRLEELLEMHGIKKK